MARKDDQIKSIETRYKGYRFRSRLEARWAVFFDYFDVHYGYENEGYELSTGRYLPDFEIDGTIFEVKPVTMGQEEIDKIERFAKESGLGIFVIIGQPWPGEYRIMHLLGSKGSEIQKTEHTFATCSDCGTLLVVSESEYLTQISSLLDHSADCITARSQGSYLVYMKESEGLIKGFKKARGARFEFNERDK